MSQEVVDEVQMNEAVVMVEVIVVESDVAVARVILQDVHAHLMLETAILDYYILYAFYDVVVVKRYKEFGVVFDSGELLIILVDPVSVWVFVYVDEVRVGYLQLGQPVEVWLRSRPNEFLRVYVERIDIESDCVSEECCVYVKCYQCLVDFHFGEQVEVFIIVVTFLEVLLVLEIAVDLYNGVEGIVWMVVDGVLQWCKLRFGYRIFDGCLEIAGGFMQGVWVLAKWLLGLCAGRAARIDGDGES